MQANSITSLQKALRLLNFIGVSLLIVAVANGAWAQQIHQIAPGQSLSIKSLPEDHILRTMSGQQMTVGQYKVAIASARQVSALRQETKTTSGLTIASAAAAAPDTIILSSNGARTSTVTLAHVQRIKLGIANRKVEPSLPSAVIGTPVGEIGKDLTIAQALSRNSADTISVGNKRFTAGQLNYIDQHLRAAGRPGFQQLAAHAGPAKAAAPKIVKVAKGTDPKTLLTLAPETVLESPGGKCINVATLRAHLDKPAVNLAIQARLAKRVGLSTAPSKK